MTDFRNQLEEAYTYYILDNNINNDDFNIFMTYFKNISKILMLEAANNGLKECCVLRYKNNLDKFWIDENKTIHRILVIKDDYDSSCLIHNCFCKHPDYIFPFDKILYHSFHNLIETNFFKNEMTNFTNSLSSKSIKLSWRLLTEKKKDHTEINIIISW
jgi:hypothetical protein